MRPTYLPCKPSPRHRATPVAKAHLRYALAVVTAADSWASSARARKVMQGNRARDTKPELAIRSVLHRRGMRYRVASRPLPGLNRSADIVFRSARVAVFIDGCFWHGCSDHYVPARSNSDYWATKIALNIQRDNHTNCQLIEHGWLPIRIWAHEDPDQAADRIIQLVKSRSTAMLIGPARRYPTAPTHHQ